MSKKRLLAFAPMLAIVAFAVMPVAAQAESPHWIVGGTELDAGKTVPVVSFGGEENLSQTSSSGEINCKSAGGGAISNVGGVGQGVTNESTFWNCKSEGCEKAGAEDKIPLTSYITTNSGSGALEGKPLAWKDLLSGGPEASKIVENLGEPIKENTKKEPVFGQPGPGEIVMELTCETPPGFSPHIVGVVETFEGELKPKLKNGSKEGTKMSETTYSGKATGSLHSEVAGEQLYVGSVKLEGYNLEELITVGG